MPSTFTWLDSSEAERRRALDAIDLFRQRDTVDELGLAGIRDTLSDLLAPGTSTIQTRAGYFLFIPWIYLDLERRRTPVEKIEARARAAELALMEALLTNTDDIDGVFGRDARSTIKRLPSSVYWAGLQRLGLRLFQGSLQRYHQNFGRHATVSAAARMEQPIEIDDDSSRAAGTWHPHIPKAPEGFPDGASLALRREDAEYLRDRIRTRGTNTIFHFVADWDGPAEDVPFAWDHPAAATLPSESASHLAHSRCFSELMHGAALLYNLLLSEKLPNAEFVEDYTQRLAEWSRRIEARRDVLQAWDRPAFWALLRRENPRIPSTARDFAERWIKLALGLDTARLPKDAHARDLVARRESYLKSDRARLQSRSHLEQWRGASGVSQFDFRWRITQSLVREIRAGLAR